MYQLEMFSDLSKVEVLLIEFGKEKEKYERCQRSFFQKLDKLQKEAESLKDERKDQRDANCKK